MTTASGASAKGRRGPYAKTEARRAEILNRAYEAFSERGFTGTSMREIALAVGLSHQAIFHHFSSKELLLSAVLEEKDRESNAVLERAAALGLREACVTLVAANLDQPALVRLFTTLSAEATNPGHPAHEYFRARYERARELAVSKLVAGQAAGEVRSDIDVERMAALILAVMDGLQIQWLLDGDFDVIGTLEEFLRTLLTGATSRTQPGRRRSRR